MPAKSPKAVNVKQLPQTSRNRLVATPNKVAGSIAQYSSTSQSFIEPPKECVNDSSLGDSWLQDKSTAERDLNVSRASCCDLRKSSSSLVIPNKTPRAGFFKAALQSSAFSSDLEREKYLVKELEVSSFGITTFSNRTQTRSSKFSSTRHRSCEKRTKD